MPRYNIEWLDFLKKIDRETQREKALHPVCDNYATRKHAKVKESLEKHSRFHIHFTPTSASRLNMVERVFRDITTERLRRGFFPGGRALTPPFMIMLLTITVA